MDQVTIDCYNKSAKEKAADFDKIGVRVADIEEAFHLVKKRNPKVFEIGCGNGRDAEYILTLTNDYLGMDASEAMIALARDKVPHGHFEIGDIEEFPIPHGVDIVFAFASFLHVPKDEFKQVLQKVHAALNPEGILRISLKYREHYEKVKKDDEFGSRIFYFYSKKDIEDMAEGYAVLKNDLLKLNNMSDTVWLEVLLQKA